MTRFIFLEFINPKIRAFLGDLRKSLNGLKKTTQVHITVRGPYTELPSLNYLEDLQEKLHGLGVYIGGVGTFRNAEGYVVYLKAQSPVFEEIWWKPDYPEQTYSKNPHITMYETPSKRAAEEVARFLRQERIEIHTFGIALRVRARKQPDLFDVEGDSSLERLPEFLETLRVKPGILSRAKVLATSLSEHSN